MNRLQKRTLLVMRNIMESREERSPVLLRVASLFMKYAPGQITCGDFESFLLDYSEGKLTPRQRHIFEAHMAICPMCRVYFDSYLQTIELLGPGLFEDPEAPGPSDLPEELILTILAAREGG